MLVVGCIILILLSDIIPSAISNTPILWSESYLVSSLTKPRFLGESNIRGMALYILLYSIFYLNKVRPPSYKLIYIQKPIENGYIPLKNLGSHQLPPWGHVALPNGDGVERQAATAQHALFCPLPGFNGDLCSKKKCVDPPEIRISPRNKRFGCVWKWWGSICCPFEEGTWW